MKLGVKAALVDGEIVAGDVRVDARDGTIADVGVRPAGAAGLAVPGFVDAHLNGFAGVDFMAADAHAYRGAARALAGTGVVAFQPTLVSAPPDRYAEPLAVAGAAAAPGLPELTGVHLEGPFLSPAWPGAHDPAHLLAPDPALAQRLCERGPVATVTIAPELPGALELIDALTGRGVLVSCGHSDADAATAHAAFERGARAITHLHNAHRRWRPRDPGIGGVALVRPDVTVQVIADGVHLAPESAHGALLAAGRRSCLVTDAASAAPLGPGEHTLAGRPVMVADGAVRLADGTLAGSLLTMDQAVRNVVGYGLPLADAVHAASTAPAALLGRADLGSLQRGAAASLAVLDEELRVLRTLVRGVEAFARG